MLLGQCHEVESPQGYVRWVVQEQTLIVITVAHSHVPFLAVEVSNVDVSGVCRSSFGHGDQSTGFVFDIWMDLRRKIVVCMTVFCIELAYVSARLRRGYRTGVYARLNLKGRISSSATKDLDNVWSRFKELSL